MKILIAEDDPVSRTRLEMMLQALGHEVLSCPDGMAAWTTLKDQSDVGLAILDWNMPGLSGPEVCRKARETITDRMVYLILLTGRTEQEAVVEGFEAGADDYLTKPFREPELKARVQAGRRIVQLQADVVSAKQDSALAETIGCVAHELNQPLTGLLGVLELVRSGRVDMNDKLLDSLYKDGSRIRDIVVKLREATRFVTTEYVGGTRILDLEAAASSRVTTEETDVTTR